MAYGARLESVLGASPRGFESPILRHRTPGPLQVPGFLLLVPRLISGRRESCPPASRPRRELRSARRLEARPGPAGLAAASNRAGHVAVSGQALPPPAGTVAWPCVSKPAPASSPLNSEALDDLCARECSQDLARHKELRSAQARADAAPSDRARRVDKEPP